MKHITQSKAAKTFFADAGIKITSGSTHNCITLENSDGGTLTLEAESAADVACGIPGIFVDKG